MQSTCNGDRQVKQQNAYEAGNLKEENGISLNPYEVIH